MAQGASPVLCDDLYGSDSGGSRGKGHIYAYLEPIHFVVQQKLTAEKNTIL